MKGMDSEPIPVHEKLIIGTSEKEAAIPFAGHNRIMKKAQSD